MANVFNGTTGNDYFYGTEEDDIFISNGGDDTFIGNGGNDYFEGSASSFYRAMGGPGDDVYVYNDTGSINYYEAPDEGIDTIVVRAVFGSFSSAVNIENFFVDFTSSGLGANDLDNLIRTIAFDIAVQTIHGLGGNDVIYSRGGGDTLRGGTGNDILVGGAGRDTLEGEAGIDTASYVDAEEGVNASLSSPGTSVDDAEGDTYSSIENLSGSRFSDTLTGDGNANRLDGGLGNDILIGNGGVDTMVGRAGHDTFSANLFNDIAVEELAAGGGTDRVIWVGTTGTFTLGANIENMVMQGTSAINGTGNALANAMSGNGAANILIGKGGNDVLTGGGAADIFVLDSAPSAANIDTLTDMTGADFIRLSKAVFAAIGPTFTSNEFRVNTTGLAGDADDRIIYEADAGRLFYDTNGNAAGGALQIATLTLKPGISIADFQFV